MLRALSTLFIITLGILGYEDVSFSARTLGMGGDQAAILDDPFSHIANPALSARWKRPATALNSSLTGVFTTSFTYVQPVKDVGVVGGNLFFRQMLGITAGDDLREADGRFFLAVPIGRVFSIGASAGSVSQEFFSESGGYPLPLRRFESGPILAMG
ncbi:hypothetical protein GF338_06915, partial [candidate division WOR-3 bacterium]|nr:hypothetical protein [candidate division WOR-3 bacterium]